MPLSSWLTVAALSSVLLSDVVFWVLPLAANVAPAVVAATALKLILTGVTFENVIATRTGNPVITITTEQVVRSTAAYQRIVTIAAVDSTEGIGAAELMADRRRIVIRARQ